MYTCSSSRPVGSHQSVSSLKSACCAGHFIASSGYRSASHGTATNRRSAILFPTYRMTSLREQKETFVTGHAGGSAAEISALAAAPALLLVLWRLVYDPGSNDLGLIHRPSTAATAAAIEFAVLVLPLVALLLNLASAWVLLGSVTAVASALLVTQQQGEWQQRGQDARRRPLPAVLRDALSTYRASLTLITCAAILGVDFPAFPRRFAKAETFGTGLMDAGVGSFVAASGLAHGLAAAARQADGQMRRGTWQAQGMRVLVLAGLGLARVLVTGAADYQNHASEYGVHWNFFLTLATLRLLSMLAPWASSSLTASAASGLLLLVAHQAGLSAALTGVVHSEDRASGLLMANKEGLLSLPGYWALQLLSTAAGYAAHCMAGIASAAKTAGACRPQRQPDSGSSSAAAAIKGLTTEASVGTLSGTLSTGNLSEHLSGTLTIQVRRAQHQRLPAVLRLLVQLAAATTALWLAYWATSAGVQPVSRRSCNAAYVLWVLALNVQCLALFAASELLLPGPMPHLLAAISSTMLPTFLAANLLTGGINLATNTLEASGVRAAAVVSAYMAALCCAASLMHRRHKANVT